MGIKEILTNLGKNNKPTYAVMAIAVVKGIARPLFTMTDKHADPETKKYTAIREGLTEVVAIPTYFACGELASKVADKLKFDHLPTPKEQAFARQSAKQNFMFLGVCIAALAVIPALASVTIKPFMKKIQENNKSKHAPIEIEQNKADNLYNNIDNKPLKTNVAFNGKKILNSTLNAYPRIKASGMKVGGIW